MEKVQDKIEKLYRDFFDELGIDYNKSNFDELAGSGIWKSAPEGKNLRFATLPHIGENYGKGKMKILFVGLDIGKDEYYKYNRFQTFDMRRDNISIYRSDCFFNKNAHMSGTYFETLFLLKDEYPDTWEKVYEFKDNQNKPLLNKLKDFLPVDLLTNIALTNYYKFVAIGREKRQGGEDRDCFGRNKEIEKLFLDEIEILAPDIIWFQGIDFNRFEIVKELKKTNKVIIGYHPSYYPVANTPQYIIDLFE